MQNSDTTINWAVRYKELIKEKGHHQHKIKETGRQNLKKKKSRNAKITITPICRPRSHKLAVK